MSAITVKWLFQGEALSISYISVVALGFNFEKNHKYNKIYFFFKITCSSLMSC